MAHGKAGRLTIHIVDLCGPEEKHDEEVAATEEGDEKDDNHGPLCLAEQCSGDHWVWSLELPDEESNDEGQAEDQRRDIVGASPNVLPE